MKPRGAKYAENFLYGMTPHGGKAPIIFSSALVQSTGACGFDFIRSRTCLSLKKSCTHCSIISWNINHFSSLHT